MNFIAHLFLSDNNEALMVGNYIGDAIKGNTYIDYHENIRNGILLHRQIDKFTDDHRISKEIKKLFTQKYHKYAGVVVDLVYDYFLCKNWNKYSPQQSLQDFIYNAYIILRNNLHLMPPKMQSLYNMMVRNNSLASYCSINGLKNTLDNMVIHKNLPDASVFAVKVLLENEDLINDKFNLFFDDMILFVDLIISRFKV